MELHLGKQNLVSTLKLWHHSVLEHIEIQEPSNVFFFFFFSTKKNDPRSFVLDLAADTFTFDKSLAWRITACGYFEPQKRTLWLLTMSMMWKVASSRNTNLSLNLNSHEIHACSRWKPRAVFCLVQRVPLQVGSSRHYVPDAYEAHPITSSGAFPRHDWLIRTNVMELRWKTCRTLSTTSSECDVLTMHLSLHRQPVCL